MKYSVPYVLVVEGKNDISFLSSFIDGLFFDTNGFDLGEDKITFLKEVNKVNKIIILTDNDEAGKKIRNKLHENLTNYIDLEISGTARKNYIKNGVAESKNEEIISLIKPYIQKDEIVKINYHLNSYFLNDIQKQKLIQKYKLVKGNNKYIENELNMLKISNEEIKEFVLRL